MEKTKVLYIITKSNFGGAQRYVYELATGLPRDRYEVVVAFGGSGLLRTKLEEAGIRTRTIQSFERDINLRKEIASMRELLLLMREEQPDVVHLNSSKAGGSGALIARLCGIKNIVFTAHGWPFHERRNILWRSVVWLLSYITALLSHHVIVVSGYDRDGARMPGITKKLVLIHTALPPLSFETRADARATLFPPHIVAKHAHDFWLVSTGEHTRNKNLGILIDALARLKAEGHANIFLTLMSDGELRTHLEDLVKLHELTDQVYFTGFVPEARTFLKAFDIFLMPSLKEGFPYGLLEAGAAGLAAVTSNVGGIPELITDGVTGILINPHDPNTLIDALTRLIVHTSPRDLPLTLTLGEALQKEVLAQYTLPRMLEKTIHVYENGSETV